MLFFEVRFLDFFTIRCERARLVRWALVALLHPLLRLEEPGIDDDQTLSVRCDLAP